MKIDIKSVNHHVEGRDFMTDLDLLFFLVRCFVGWER